MNRRTQLGVSRRRMLQALDVDGQDHAKLLVSIAQLMGLETSSIGNRKPDSGPLSGLV